MFILQSLIKQHGIEKSNAHVVVITEEGKIATKGLREHLIKVFEKDLEIGLVQKRETLEQRCSVKSIRRVGRPGSKSRMATDECFIKQQVGVWKPFPALLFMFTYCSEYFFI
ncbi:hypothetical protein MKX01_038703 [Papaver californicum]|nr:hypothetical protein MKX01_038703 [Papaver californicum]